MHTSNDLIPLCVPPWNQTEALEQGAGYSEKLGFFVPPSEHLDSFYPWLPLRFNPHRPKPCLVPEMLPATTGEQNIRHLIGPETWDRMRKHAYQAAGFRCEVCGQQGRLEAHEGWKLYNETCVQKLTHIMALCVCCHKAKHLGYAKKMGILPMVKQKLMLVNGWTPRELDIALKDTYEEWEQRAYWPWTVDLSWLQDNGYLYV